MPDLSILFIYNMPFRALAKVTGGLVSERMVDDIVFLVNGHFWRGLGRVIADFFRSQRESRKFSARLARLEKQFKEKTGVVERAMMEKSCAEAILPCALTACEGGLRRVCDLFRLS